MKRLGVALAILAAVAGLSCRPGQRLTDSDEVVTAAESVGEARAASVDYEYGCDNLGIRVIEDGPTQVRVQISTAYAEGGQLHCALYRIQEGEPQRRVALERRSFSNGGSLTVALGFPETQCGVTYQWDCARGWDVPDDGNYSGQCFIGGRLTGTYPCDKDYPVPTPEPTPRPTPTPECGEECQATPTPTPRPTPTPTPSPEPCSTPSEVNWLGWVSTGDTLTASVVVTGGASVNVELRAASNILEYLLDNPDFVKVQVPRVCDDNGAKLLSYHWAGHGSEYWWVSVPALGFKGPVIVNTHN